MPKSLGIYDHTVDNRRPPLPNIPCDGTFGHACCWFHSTANIQELSAIATYAPLNKYIGYVLQYMGYLSTFGPHHPIDFMVAWEAIKSDWLEKGLNKFVIEYFEPIFIVKHPGWRVETLGPNTQLLIVV